MTISSVFTFNDSHLDLNTFSKDVLIWTFELRKSWSMTVSEFCYPLKAITIDVVCHLI